MQEPDAADTSHELNIHLEAVFQTVLMNFGFSHTLHAVVASHGMENARGAA